jgi:hypothetical protein
MSHPLAHYSTPILKVLVAFTCTIALLHLYRTWSINPPLIHSRINDKWWFNNHTAHTYSPEQHNLSQDQCILHFPKLYTEADRAREWYQHRGGISKEAVEEAYDDGGNANARLLILDNKVRSSMWLCKRRNMLTRSAVLERVSGVLPFESPSCYSRRLHYAYL